MLRLGLIFFSIFLVLGFKKENNSVHLLNRKAKKRTRIFIIDYVNSRWTGPIVKSFQQSLDKTAENISYYHFIWTEKTKDEQFLKDIIDGKPDIIFLPDHLFYRKYARELFAKTSAHISAHLCSADRSDILLNINQSGVFNEYPADKILDFAQKTFRIKKIAILGGPYASDSIKKIKNPLENKAVTVDSFSYSKWFDYKSKLLQIEKDYDAVWLLLPFGVMDGDYPVNFKKLEPIAKRLKIPSFGYGGITSFPRTITMGSVQEKLGEFCATLLYASYFKGGKAEIKNYVSYDVHINTKHFLYLGKKITDELTPFLR